MKQKKRNNHINERIVYKTVKNLNQAEALYSLKITGTDEGGKAPTSVIIF